MAFKQYLIEEARKQISFPLFEAINGHLAKTVAALAARENDDNSAAGVDFKRLGNILTTLKIITDKDLHSGITKDDIGFDPNDVKDIFGALDRVPDSVSAKLPVDLDKFFVTTAALSNSVKREELKTLAKLLDKDETVRATAVKELKQLSIKIDQLYNKLKTLAKK